MLIDQCLLPTSSIVRNLAEKLIGGVLGTGDFALRREDSLKSLYVRNIDSNRTKAK